MWNKNNQARIERKQDRLDSGFVAKHFPEVSSIVINMMYTQKGAKSLLRTVNFSPDSYAFFRVSCLSSDCVDGGFDMSQIITSMIRNHREEEKGNLACDDSGPRADHSSIAYDVAIQYT